MKIGFRDIFTANGIKAYYRGSGTVVKTMPFGDKEIAISDVGGKLCLAYLPASTTSGVVSHATLDGLKFPISETENGVHMFDFVDTIDDGEDVGWSYNGTVISCTKDKTIFIAQPFIGVVRYDYVEIGTKLIELAYDGTYYYLTNTL
jgi:hypothetical protein